MARFLARVQQELAVQGLGRGAREDSLPEFLDDVLAALRAGVYPPAARHVRHAHAQAHGAYRRASGAEVTALVREYGLLRDSVFELLEAQGVTPGLRELRILDECVSAAVTDAVAAYGAASEQALRESGTLLQALLDRAPVAIYVKDREGRYTLVNAHFCSALQVTREQTLGHTDHELFSPEQASAVRANDERVLRENAPLELEEVVGHRDGPHTYLTIKFPIPGEDGHPEAVGGISTDLTARKRAEDVRAFFIEAGRALAESLDFEATLKTLARLAVERLADFCMLDLLGEDGQLHRLEVASRDPALAELIERTRPYPPRMGSGHPVARVVETGRPLAVAPLTSAWLDASAANAEHRAVLEALAPRAAVVAPLVAHGRTLGVINLASRDPERSYGPDELALVQAVADRAAVALANARLYRQAQEAVRTREDVLAIVSHDLKSPLGVVGMTAGQLLRHAGEDEGGRRTARYAQTIQRSADRMSRLIRDLLDVASIESGSLGLELRQHEAASLLHEVAEALEPLAQDKGLRLRVSAARDPLHVRADRERVIQVLTNVVGNALKYAPAGSHVVLRCERLDGAARFEVHDEGPGIGAEQLPHIFERFWKAGPARGTGLGLFICRGIVEGHGGRIWAQSAPGHGTRVFFTLPLDAEA